MTALTKHYNTNVISKEYFGDTVVDAFIASRHCSENTAKTYRNAVRQLLKYFAANKITAPTTADVDAFINELRGAKKSASTLRLYSTCTKLFFSFLSKRGFYPDVTADAAPLKLRKSTTHNRKSLTDEQAQKLLHAVKGDSLIARRNRAIIALALQTGVRTVEISRAAVGNFQPAGDYWTLAVVGKGHQQADAIVKVAAPVAELILSYLELRGNVADDEPLFASVSNNRQWTANKYGSRLSEQSVGKLIKAAMKAAGIVDRKISAHSCRHYAATTAIEAGCDIREVSAMLRHTSIVITSIYLHDLSLKTRRAEMAVANKLFSFVA